MEDSGNSGRENGSAESLIEEFIELGNTASYHFADDTCDEWDLGYSAQRKALAIFDAHPELQDEMRKRQKFLWTLELSRPKKGEKHVY